MTLNAVPDQAEVREKARDVLNHMLDKGYDCALEANWDGRPIVNVTANDTEAILWIAAYAKARELVCKVGHGRYLTIEV